MDVSMETERRRSCLWILGSIQREYGITPDGTAHLGQVGGSAAYAGAGARLWGPEVCLLSRVGEPVTLAELQRLDRLGLDTDSVRPIPSSEGGVHFYAYNSRGELDRQSAAAHFLHLGLPLPKPLLTFRGLPDSESLDAPASPLALRPGDLPERIAGAAGAHLAPCEYFTQATVPARLRQLGVRHISLAPAPGLLDPSHHAQLAEVLFGVDAFLASEEQLAFWSRANSPSLPQAASALAAMGPQVVAITCGAGGAFIWSGDLRSGWQVPAYPATVRDPHGAGHAFAGGFLAGWSATADPVEAGLWGCVSASIALEGSGAEFVLKGVPGLAEARREHLRPAIRRM